MQHQNSMYKFLNYFQNINIIKIHYNIYIQQNIKKDQMKIMFNYKGINKVMRDPQNFDEIVKFINENFFLKMSKWNMSYVDADGDSISLDTDLDVQTMLETIQKDQLKVYIKDAQGGENHAQQINIEQDLTQKIQNYQEPVKEEKSDKIKNQINQVQIEDKKQCRGQMNMEYGHHGWGHGHGHGKGHWKKKMEEKMAKFVDERVEALIPYLTKKIQESLGKKQKKQEAPKADSVNHQVKCNVCGAQSIFGIRYKCVKCPLFNLCQKCQNEVGHNHNLIKMRFLEQPEPESEWGRPFWMKHMQPPGAPGGHHMPPPPPHMANGPMGPMGFPRFGFPLSPPHMQVPNRRQERQQSCDPRLKITKKCFKMSKLFGGDPSSYEQFVAKNAHLRVDDLSQLYIQMNEGVKISQESNEKAEQKAKKLGFYFNTSPEEYYEITKKNPSANLRQLLNIINESKKQEVPEKKEQTVQKKEEKIENKEEPKVIIEIPEKKIQQEKPVVPEAPKIEIKPEPVPVPVKKNYIEPKKRNKCVLQLKELLGEENVFDYIKFYNKNHELSNETIIERYLESITK